MPVKRFKYSNPCRPPKVIRVEWPHVDDMYSERYCSFWSYTWHVLRKIFLLLIIYRFVFLASMTIIYFALILCWEIEEFQRCFKYMRYVWVLHEYHAILLRNLIISGLCYPRGISEERLCGYWRTSDPTNMWLVGLGLLSSLRGVYIYFSSVLACKSPEICKNYFCFLDLCVKYPETYPFKTVLFMITMLNPSVTPALFVTSALW